MNHLKDFFYYTRTERNGVMVLLGLLTILLLLPYTFSMFFEEKTSNYDVWKEDINAFEAGLSQQPIAKHSYKKKKGQWNVEGTRSSKPKKATKLRPSKFDPNTVIAMDLEAMGLPERTIKSILNYRAKGGQFRHKEALQKIYTLSDEHYQQLYPFIDLEKKEEWPNKKKEGSPLAAKPLPPAFDFDPNSADAAELERLGLPTNTIRSILNYRKKGGTFRKKEDFKKIYTLPDSLYQHLLEHIIIKAKPTYATKPVYQPKSYQKIDINTATISRWTELNISIKLLT